MNKCILNLIFLVFVSSSSYSDETKSLTKMHPQELLKLKSQLFNYIYKDFEKHNEFSSYMMNDNDILLLGRKGKFSYDSNLFVQTSVYNILYQSILETKSEKEIDPRMYEILKKSMLNILSYQNQKTQTFGFWPLHELEEKYKRKKDKGKKILIRTPKNYVLDNRFIKLAGNVPDDADDTSLSFISMKYHDQLFGTNFSPSSVIEILSAYTDTIKHRKSLHYYNVLYGFNVFTGAFMTWLYDEKIFTPWSWVPRRYDRPYIPYGANEVDCVVNANVLNSLAHYSELNEHKSVKKSCDFILKSFKNKKRRSTCGAYYPNTYHLYYVSAKALAKGVKCLEPLRNKIPSLLNSERNLDGSYHSQSATSKKFSRKIIKAINSLETLRSNETYKSFNFHPYDPIQSTLYAALSKVYLNNFDIKQELTYLLSQIQVDKNNNDTRFLKGGVFFSGGTLVRDDLKWRSNLYTSALMFELITLYLNQQKEST